MTDPIVTAAQFLAGQVEWIRHRREADEFVTDVEACLRIVRSIAWDPAPKRYLGPCGAERQHVGACAALMCYDDPDDCACWCHRGEAVACEGDVYAREGAQRGRCTTCGAEVAADERRAWLDEQVRAWAFRASEIAAEYRINVKTIRGWATRGQLKSYWRTEAGLVTPWVDPVLDPKLEGEAMEKRLGEISDEIQARGGRLHYVGDVLDLAAGDAARREGDRATRARRAAARAAESETAA
jgi:hypothetical protein